MRRGGPEWVSDCRKRALLISYNIMEGVKMYAFTDRPRYLRGHMRVLKFSVNEQKLVYHKDKPIIIGSKGYLKAAFDLSDEWDGLRVAAQFFDARGNEFAVLLQDSQCMVPDAVTQDYFFKVSLIGVGPYVLTTNKVTIRQEM